MNRWKERMRTKLKSRISQSSLNEFTIHKVLRNLQAVLYKIPNSIEANASFEIRPFLKCSAESRGFELDDAKQMKMIVVGDAR